MAQDEPEVKRKVRIVVVWLRCRDWMDAHPRTGWYVVMLLSIDVVLSILDLVH